MPGRELVVKVYHDSSRWVRKNKLINKPMRARLRFHCFYMKCTLKVSHLLCFVLEATFQQTLCAFHVTLIEKTDPIQEFKAANINIDEQGGGE